MMILRKVLFAVAVLLLFATYLPAADTILVYGPRVFTSHSGPPAAATASITLPQLVYGPFALLARYQDLPVAPAETSNDLPTEIDWRTKGAVTPVKNQGQCDSGWAFSATGAVEGVVAINTGSLISLSEQQLVDCSGSTGNQGCQGGHPVDAFKWIIKNGGICSESSYPYTARDGTCKRTCTPVGHISAWLELPRDEETLKAHVAEQPVSVEVDASSSAFQNYKSGVFSGPCGKTLNQAVLIVGYGETSGKRYWIVKNSWGTSWGLSGYILIERGRNLCGIADMAVVPKY
jgi:C1A family cysteine protease